MKMENPQHSKILSLQPAPENKISVPEAAGKTNCRISKMVVPLFTASAPKLMSSDAFQGAACCGQFKQQPLNLQSHLLSDGSKTKYCLDAK